MQIHGQDGDSPPFDFSMLNGHDGGNRHVGRPGFYGLYFVDTYIPNNTRSNDSAFHLVVPLDSLVNKAHTISLKLKEGTGSGGQSAFVQVFFDGKLKYQRTVGKVGSTLQHDYLKFASLYDWAKALVDPANHQRGRKFPW